jgi:hypothetical protein
MPPDTAPLTVAKLMRDDGETIRARTAAEVTDFIDFATKTPETAPFVQRARTGEGTGCLGLYVEAVSFDAANQPFSHMKFFVIGEHLYVYNRSQGDARANWRHRSVASLEVALQTVQTALSKGTVKLLGHPVLVELTADDLSAVETNQMPPSRFRGQSRISREFGTYDFDGEVTSKPMPSTITSMLRSPTFVTASTLV